MARDYGQRNPGGNRQARGRNEMPGWVWLLVGLSIGLGIAAYVYITRPVHTEPVAAVKKPGAKKPIPIPPEKTSRFSFYEILPNYKVVIPRNQDDDSGEPASLEPGAYVIQVGAFTERSQAEEQRAKLALIGVESRVEQGANNGQKWFRVLIGPDKDLARLNSVTLRLKDNGVESFLVRVPG